MPVCEAVYGYWSMVMSTPRAPRRVDEGQALGALPPRRAADRLVVGHLHGNARLLADADRLAHRVEQPLGLVAHVRDVDAPVPGRHRRERDDLLGRREAARHVEEARRQAERARLHRFGHERAHAVELVARRRAVLGPQHLAANRALPREDGPVRADAGGGNLVQMRADGPRRAAVVALGQSGDPLQQVVVGGRHVEDAAHGVGVRVDEPGGHHEPGRVDHAIRDRVGQVADARDAVPAHTDVGPDPRVPRPVDDPAAAHDQIEALRPLRERGRGQEDRPQEHRKKPCNHHHLPRTAFPDSGSGATASPPAVAPLPSRPEPEALAP